MTWYPFSIHPDYKMGQFQPYLPIKIIQSEIPENSVIAGALVDTGSLSTKIVSKYADYINLDYKSGDLVSNQAVGGSIQGYLCKCRVQVLDMNEKGEALPESVLMELTEEKIDFGECFPVCLLGVRDFLRHLKLKIDYPKKRFSIERPN